MYEIVIFLTGAATLALEVLSSRVLTPYFGVSLYIWTGILSVTLTFLAIGYFLGGRVARRLSGPGLTAAFFGAPAVSALAIVAACLVYPWIFRPLALMDLALGSILAAAVLLAAPLIVLSAMNPLLVALGRASGGRRAVRAPAAGGPAGDAGAGRVFFISTLGSVAGVIATAFLLIPHLSNFRGLLLLAVVLGACAAAGCAVTPLPRTQRTRLAATAGAGLVAAGLLFALAPAYLGKDRAIMAGGLSFRIVAEYGSVYGNLKVVDLSEPGKPQNFIRMFLNDGLIQNRLLPEGRSFSEYTYALDRLAAAFVPQARRALVLGLGAGAVPRMLSERGLSVEVVEINPDMLRATLTQVPGSGGDKPLPYAVHIADARSFVQRCAGGFDVVVVDLFHGDGTPDYLQTADFFRDLARCLAPRGAAVMNTFFAVGRDAGYTPLLATIRAAFPNLVRFTPVPGPDDVELNSYLVAFDDAPLPAGVDLGGVIPTYRDSLAETMRQGRRVRDDEIQGVPVATDEHNIQSVLSAAGFMVYRGAVVRQLPPQLLVN